jgi:Kef-type K+ transport system membrane component KefB/mannitol/fructose-specific phosphotransferase system IIA component (Ntr-type)
MRKTAFILVFAAVAVACAFAEEGHDITSDMANMVLQLGVLLFAVKLGGALAKLAKLPSVLGELLAGVAIGPYALGGIGFPGMPQGLFPIPGGGLAVSPELYGFSTVASIILLFMSGLETDIGLFLKYSVAGIVVGLGGVIISFAAGVACGPLLLGKALTSPESLFLGIMSTATSVGITARILSDRKKMDSPEGVTILAAAVFDDVIGIVALAVVLGVVALQSGHAEGGASAGGIAMIAVRAFGIWLGFTALGLIFSKRIARFLKRFKSSSSFSVLALGLALLLAGVMEKEGLAMIIGAYVIGMSLSRTDIAPVISEKLHGLYEFFVPVFFAVMGMLVDVRELMNPTTLLVGGVYTLVAIASKVLGCGLPSLALGFNAKGAGRIGVGMVPRGEVALIIAGIGISGGFLDRSVFGVAVMMTLLTTLFAPPALSMALKVPGRGTKKEAKGTDTVETSFEFPNRVVTDLVTEMLLRDLRVEGFYVQTMDYGGGISQARKGDVAFTIREDESHILFESAPEDVAFIKTAVYEVFVKLDASMARMKSELDPEELKADTMEGKMRVDREVLKSFTPDYMKVMLSSSKKEGVIRELVDLLAEKGALKDANQAFTDVMEREKSMSTGMEFGIAMPHAHTDAVDKLCVAVGTVPKGVDFDSIDGKPSTIVVLILSPRDDTSPHLQLLATAATILCDARVRSKALSAREPQVLHDAIVVSAK